jgi:hypothetical protein
VGWFRPQESRKSDLDVCLSIMVAMRGKGGGGGWTLEDFPASEFRGRGAGRGGFSKPSPNSRSLGDWEGKEGPQNRNPRVLD